jgi:hypothetical protein
MKYKTKHNIKRYLYNTFELTSLIQEAKSLKAYLYYKFKKKDNISYWVVFK